MGRDLPRYLRTRRLLYRDPGTRHHHRQRPDRRADGPHAHRYRQAGGRQSHCHQRLPLPAPRGRAGAGRHHVHWHERQGRRPQPHAHDRLGVLYEDRGGDAGDVPVLPRGLRQHARDRRQVLRRAGLGLHHPAALPAARPRRDTREPVPPRVREGPAPALW